ncbi:MAG: 50S ribosomal protein L23 [Candidatus Gracilibacteria bacterium]|jgi:ribosomal protein L23
MDIYSVILGSVDSHKSRMLEMGKVYTFRVAENATKIDVKRAFHALYNKTVVSVQMARNYLKTKNAKKGTIRRRASFKKAYVRLESPVTQLAKLHTPKDQ